MKKINFFVILIQLSGMIFLIHGILQLRYYSVAEQYICAVKHFQGQQTDCWNELFPTKEILLDFWPSIYIWIFLGLLIGIFVISFLNWKHKFSSLNSIIVAIVMYIIIRLKFFRRGVFSRLFHSFTSAFSDDITVQFIVGGVLFTLMGLAILWLSVHPSWFSSRKDLVSN
ncbi:hypothetical protein CLU81_1764 [Flavobacterium sp. 9]|uniref:hypothetical protein n=1 Tax=Flavobacterium sp. 9 TaxID=2035198 RepID=UPI000C187E34|nr:hypothetical protein [Flavobacterium sp. 9]PIF31278.1 hypothetical protein CLU81_1764 [Flavobacterium sp. 9]